MRKKGNIKRFIGLLFSFCYILLLFGFERLIRFNVIGLIGYSNNHIVWGIIDLPYYLSLSLGLVVLFAVFFWLWKNKIEPSKMLLIAIINIFVGLVLNLFDWILYGGIWDYLLFWKWYFNFADIYIMFGLLIMAINIFKGNNKTNEE